MGRWDWDSATKNMVPHGFLRPGWSPTPSHSLWLDARFHSARCCPKATRDQTELSLTKERYSDIAWILILFCDKTEYVACICTCNYIYIYRLYTSYNTQKRDSFAVVEVEESESLHRVGYPSNRVEDDWSQHVTGWILDSWCLKKKLETGVVFHTYLAFKLIGLRSPTKGLCGQRQQNERGALQEQCEPLPTINMMQSDRSSGGSKTVRKMPIGSNRHKDVISEKSSCISASSTYILASSWFLAHRSGMLFGWIQYFH